MIVINLMLKDIKIFFKSKSAVIISFLVPLVISVIFGLVFGSFGGKKEGISEIKVLLTDLDNSETSERLRESLNNLEEITVFTKFKDEEDFKPFTTKKMDEFIKEGEYKLGILIPKGFEKNLTADKPKGVEIHYDPKFSIEFNILNGLLQKISFTEFPNLILDKLWNQSEDRLGKDRNLNFKNSMHNVVEKYFPEAEFDTKFKSNSLPDSLNLFNEEVIPISSQKLLGKEEESGKNMYFQYIAGMAVMFLLFSVAENGASLIEEKQNGTMKRLMTAPIKDYQILLGKLLYSSFTGTTQLIVLFLFGWVIFSLDIFASPFSLIVLLLVTSFASSSLGILLAAVCKNKKQVNSISTIIILGMSVLGGSMFPYFLMPDYLKEIGKFTLNYWAMDGFTSIFWRKLNFMKIYPNILVLLLLGIMSFIVALSIFKSNKFKRLEE